MACELCGAVYRVREHIEGVLSAFENQIETARAHLISAIDVDSSHPAILLAKDFLEKYRNSLMSKLASKSPSAH